MNLSTTMNTIKASKSIKTMKTMKTMKQNYFLKAAGVVAVLVLMSNQATAQKKTGDFTKAAAAVKVVDNKGTIKYFQASNGISQITNTTDNVTTTTWQLGGTLTDDTYIDATGKVFALNGLELNTTSKPSADGTATSLGYTLLVSDAATGKVERKLATSLIQGGTGENTVPTTVVLNSSYTFSGLVGLSSVANRISVFRNGIKLRPTDWTIATSAATATPPSSNTIEIKATADLPIYKDDVLDVQWVN